MSWLGDFLGLLVGLLLFFMLAIALTAPFEALGWWSGWSKRSVEAEMAQGRLQPRADANPHASHYLLFFTGILGFEGGAAGGRELRLLEAIASRLPGDAVVVHDVFPYSVSNNPLSGERYFARTWKWVDERRRKLKSLINFYNFLIVSRNLFQVAVSADPRYGPLYNVGVAREMVQSLVEHGYPPDSNKPLTIVCYSGGGQIAVGSAPYVQKALGCPVRIVSIGGVMTDDRGIASVDRLVHLQGSRDPVTWIGALLYPGRWPLLTGSAWNRARRAGRLITIPVGPMTHFGRSDYFSHSAKFADGQTYVDKIADIAAVAILDSD